MEIYLIDYLVWSLGEFVFILPLRFPTTLLFHFSLHPFTLLYAETLTLHFLIGCGVVLVTR